MSYHWIDAKDYTLNCILLFDRWALRWIFTDCNAFEWFPSDGRDYKTEMAKALYRYPHVIEYVRAKAPECAAFLDEYRRSAPNAELTSRGFEWFRHESNAGGIIYNYRKQVRK